MNDQTARALNALNRAFYAATADDFDATRAHPWPGWVRLLSLLPAAPLRVLDVGCGNGRFGVFLASHFPSIDYHGLDNSPALLSRARAALSALPNVRSTLVEGDVVESLLADPRRDGREAQILVNRTEQTGEAGFPSPAEDVESLVGASGYDLVALFGVLHHIPGAARRRALARALAQQVRAGGLLTFACWRFYEFPRFRSRIIPFPPGLDVEPGDYLLDWRRGTQALRYCHHVNDAEQADLIAVTELTLIETYRADGESGDMNAYVVLRR
jgi:tRNA (uracil-5-)-methyltransferase TRM9